jgi:ribonucleoside-diphosphate reductase alpha chain
MQNLCDLPLTEEELESSLSRIRGRGANITGNGKSEGIVPWAKIYDSTIIATNQGSVRRGAASVNLDINHPDIHEFLQIRRPKGDANRQCLKSSPSCSCR